MNETAATSDLIPTDTGSFLHGSAWSIASIIQIVILAVLIFFGTFGNILVVVTICRDRKLRVPGNYFIINLTVADLIITSISIPVILSNLIRENLKQEVKADVDTFCQTTAYLKVLGLHVSWYSLAFIALNRYYSLCRMHEYATYFTKNRVLATIGMIWIFTTLINFPIMAGWAIPNSKIYPENSTESYYYSYKRNQPPVIYDKSSHDCVLGVRNQGGYTYANGFFVISLPLISIIFCYSLVTMEIVRNRRKMENSMNPKQLKRRYQKEMKISVMLAIVVVAFMLCWAPAIIYDYAIVMNDDEELDIARLVFSWLALSNSAMNPGLYALLSKAFRNGYKKNIQIALGLAVCRSLNTRTDQSELSSVSNSRSERINSSQRRPRFAGITSWTKVTDNKTNSPGQSVAETTGDRKKPKRTKGTAVAMVTVRAETHASSSFRGRQDLTVARVDSKTKTNSQKRTGEAPVPIQTISSELAATPTTDAIVAIYPVPGEATRKELPTEDTIETAKFTPDKNFKPLLEQLDDENSKFTQSGIYIGGSVPRS